MIVTMLGIRYLSLLSLAALARAQTINVDQCGVNCYDQALAKAGEFNCAAHDMACLCPVPNFFFSIRDCAAKGCPPGYEPTVTNAVSALCATFTGAPTPSPTTAASAAPTTTEASTTTTESTSQVSSTTTSDSSSSSTTSETSTTTSAAPTTSKTAPTTASSGKPSTSSAQGAAASSTSTSQPAEAGGAAPSGLSEAAKIGLGVGIAAVVLALLGGLAAFVLVRRRRDKQPSMPNHRYKISGPMPNTEHAYTYRNNSEYDIGESELEMKSNRYEEMMPGQQPRQMV